MKRYLLTLLVMGLGAAYAFADAQPKADTKFHIPVSDNHGLPPSIDLFGVDVSTVQSDGTVVANQGTPARTTAKLWFTGEGVFYDLVVGIGSCNVFCFDAATASDGTSETTTYNLVAIVQRSSTEAQSFGGIVLKGATLPIRIHAGLVCDSANDSIYWPVFLPK